MRTDVHKPSAIVPADYEYVGEECCRIEGLGDAQFLQEQRDRVREHQARTGGKYSAHEHGGNCMVCGSVNAIYTSLFFHSKTNTYVRMGADCADKCDLGGNCERNLFRRNVQDARENLAGKRKAEALLSDAGASGAWVIYVADYNSLPRDPRTAREGREVKDEFGNVMEYTEAYAGSLYYEELTIRDIVGKLVRYGSVTDKTMDLLKRLLFSIPDRDARNAERTAKREAERAAAKPAPMGRVKIEGTVLKVETREESYNYHATFRKVMLVKSDEGWLCWGSVPSGAWDTEKDCRIVFTATVEPSEKDPKFAFFKRPRLVSEAKAAGGAA